MCIRDRFFLAPFHRPVFRPVSHETQTGAIASHSFGKDTACLLYTSDAADERSSVDLGGRRIIKKKSTGVTTCTPTQTSR